MSLQRASGALKTRPQLEAVLDALDSRLAKISFQAVSYRLTCLACALQALMRPASGLRPRSLSSGCCGADAGTQAAVCSTFKLSSGFLWSRSGENATACTAFLLRGSKCSKQLLQHGWVLLLFFLHLLVAVLQEGSGAQGSESEALAACLECTIESFPYTLVTNARAQSSEESSKYAKRSFARLWSQLSAAS